MLSIQNASTVHGTFGSFHNASGVYVEHLKSNTGDHLTCETFGLII